MNGRPNFNIYAQPMGLIVGPLPQLDVNHPLVQQYLQVQLQLMQVHQQLQHQQLQPQQLQHLLQDQAQLNNRRGQLLHQIMERRGQLQQQIVEQKQQTELEELTSEFKAQMTLPLEEIQKNFPAKCRFDLLNEAFYRISVESNRWDVVRFLENEIPPQNLPIFFQMVTAFASLITLPLDEIKKSLDPNLGNLPRNYIYKIYYHAAKEKRLDVLKYLADDLKIDLVRWESFKDDWGYHYDFFEGPDLNRVFMAALDNNDLPMVQWLIGEKKYLTACNKVQSTWILEYALFHADNIDIIKYLVTEENFALKTTEEDLSGDNYEHPKPVSIAIAMGRLDILKWLVEEQGQTLDDYMDMDVIHTLCFWIEDVTYLCGFRINDYKASIIKQGRLEVLKWLVEEKGLSLATLCLVVDLNINSDLKRKNNVLETIFMETKLPTLTFPILEWLLSEHADFVIECFKDLDNWVNPENMKKYFEGLPKEELASIVVDLKGCIDKARLHGSDNVKSQLQNLLFSVIEKIGIEEIIDIFSRKNLCEEAAKICKLGIAHIDGAASACRIKLVDMLLMGHIAPLVEYNSPLNAKSEFLINNNFLLMRTFQELYLLENDFSEAAMRIKAQLHKIICNKSDKVINSASFSVKDWPLEAIYYYSLYKLYKTSPESTSTADLCSRFVEMKESPVQRNENNPYRAFELLREYGNFGSSESRKRKRGDDVSEEASEDDEVRDAKRARPES